MSVSLVVFLCEVFDESLISHFDISVVHFDFVRLYAEIICFSFCYNYSLLFPFAICVVLDDYSIFYEEFIDCRPSFLLCNVHLVVMSLLYHLLVFHKTLHRAWQEGLRTPPMESFMGTASAPWLNVRVHFKAEFTELQLACLVTTPFLQYLTDALANTFCSTIALGVVGTAKCVLHS